ncbi:MAG: c-type cytochrome [Roseobacter sp.]|jgi:cytochrome c|nr:c-type cytochrome [Roseobacter sp.]
MKRTFAALIALSFTAAPAFAEGDAEAGAKVFNKCKSCHMIVSDAGEEIVKGGKVGPNLYGVFNRAVGSVEGFRYSSLYEAAGAQGLMITLDNFGAYLADPSGYIQEATGESGKGKMQKQRVKDEDVVNLHAYLVSVGPSPES